MCSTSKAEECLSLISNLSAEVARLAKRLEKLERREEMLSEDIDDIKAELKTKNKRNKYELGEYLREWEAAHTLSRKEIVEQAKADIEKMKRTISFNVEFVVNREKRTIVALLKWNISVRVYAKGIAKCAPDDCFNEDIGKAIALRRALGEEVPQEYTNAPQPEGVEVGDVVRWTSFVDEDKTDIFRVSEATEKIVHFVDGGWDYIRTVRVIDDSDREEYR